MGGFHGKEDAGRIPLSWLYGEDHGLGRGQKTLTVEFATKAHEE